MTEKEAKEFMAKPLPERFHIFMLSEMCDEAGYEEMMRNNDYNYLPVLQQVKEKMPKQASACLVPRLVQKIRKGQKMYQG